MHIYTYIVNSQNYNSWYIQQTFTFIKFEKTLVRLWTLCGYSPPPPPLPVNNEFSGFIKTV